MNGWMGGPPGCGWLAAQYEKLHVLLGCDRCSAQPVKMPLVGCGALLEWWHEDTCDSFSSMRTRVILLLREILLLPSNLHHCVTHVYIVYFLSLERAMNIPDSFPNLCSSPVGHCLAPPHLGWVGGRARPARTCRLHHSGVATSRRAAAAARANTVTYHTQ